MLSKSNTCSGKIILTGILKKCFTKTLLENLQKENWQFDTNLLGNGIIKASLENVYISSSIGSKIVSIHKLNNNLDMSSYEKISQEIISRLNELGG